MKSTKAPVLLSPRSLALAFGTMGSLLLLPSFTHAADTPVVVERVVAIVDQYPILLSEVQRRAHIAYARSRDYEHSANDPLPTKVLAGAVDTIVDEVLLRREAEERQLSVSDEEVSRALDSVAASNGLTVEQVYAEALKEGVDRSAYRKEMIRTLLEYKLMQIVLLPKVQVEDREVREAYAGKLVEMRARHAYRPAWVVIRIPKDADPERAAKLRAKAEAVTEQSRDGTDFASLARRYSDDESTRGRGGDLGLRVPQGQAGMTLPPDLQHQASMLGKGETSDPIRIDDAFVVLHLLDRSALSVPSFESSQEAIRAQLFDEALSRERKKWLRSLRQKYAVELRFVPIRGEEDGP